MRLVWVVIPLVLISIVGVQESFAEEFKIIEIVYPIEQYIDSDLIVKGFIIDKKNWNGTTNIYDVKVENYFKNSYNGDVVSILAKESNIDASFFTEVKDDVLLHLKKTDRKDLRERDLFSISFYNSLIDNNQEINISPLKQLQIIQKGYPLEKIACNSSLELIYKYTDNSPACVKPQSVERLMSLGWAKQNTDSPKTWIEIIPIQCGNVWENYRTNSLEHYPGTAEKHVFSLGQIEGMESLRIKGLIMQQHYEDKGAEIFERKFIPNLVKADICEGCFCNAGGYGWHFLISTNDIELFQGWHGVN